MEKPRIAILGAGPVGLGAAYRLVRSGTAHDVVLEQHRGLAGHRAASIWPVCVSTTAAIASTRSMTLMCWRTSACCSALICWTGRDTDASATWPLDHSR